MKPAPMNNNNPKQEGKKIHRIAMLGCHTKTTKLKKTGTKYAYNSASPVN